MRARPARDAGSRRIGTALLFLGAWVLLLPVLVALAGVFWADGALTLAPLRAAFSDPSRQAALAITTAQVTLGTVGVALLFGAPLGFLAFRTELPGRTAVRIGCLIAACLPVYVTTTCWLALTGLPFWLYKPWGAAWLGGMAYTPLVALISGVAFASGSRDLEDLAAQDTTPFGVLRHAVLPQSIRALTMAAGVVAVLSLWDITITDILMVRTFAEEVFTQFQLGAGPARAVAVSLPAVAVSLLLWAALGRLLRPYGEAADPGHVQPPALLRLGPWRPVAITAVLLLGVALLAWPVSALVRAVGSFAQLLTAWHATSPELLGTLRVTPLAATLTTALALGAAWAALERRRLAPWILGATLLMLAVPGPALGIGLIRVFNRPGAAGLLYDSEGILVLAYGLRAFPFALLVLLPALRQIPRDIRDAALLDGHSGPRLLVSVVVPLVWRSLAAAWLLAFVLSLAELGASFLVAPPGHTTLTTRFFTLIHYGVYPDAAGLCLLLLGLVCLPALALALLLGPSLSRKWN